MARSYSIKIVDAFTAKPFAGNPCAVLTHAEGLSAGRMQAVAKEMNLSETAFVTPSDVADFRVRFFTPGAEIPLAGHPTIATMHALTEEGRIAVPERGTANVTQELNVGVLPVSLRNTDDGVLVTMTQATSEFLAEIPTESMAQTLGIAVEAIPASSPVQVVSTGTHQAMVPVNSLETLRHVQVDAPRLAKLEAEHDFFGLHLFTLDPLDSANRAHSRHFVPNASIPEDPVTGSASGAMGAYLWRYGLVREPTYTVEQGHLMGRDGIVRIEVDADGDTPTTVRVAGTAVTVLTGNIEV